MIVQIELQVWGVPVWVPVERAGKAEIVESESEFDFEAAAAAREVVVVVTRAKKVLGACILILAGCVNAGNLTI